MNQRLGSLLVAAALASACGGESNSPPTSPAQQASATANGSSGTVSADGTKTGTTTRADAIAGTISVLAGTCPNLTFKVEAKTVKTDAATTYVEKGCSELKDGVRVGVSGTAQADGSILAKYVKFAPPPPPPPALAEGTVSALSGTCPTITFTVAGKTFTTDSQTRFGDGGCAAVKKDAKVGVAYQTRTDGSVRVLAVKVIPPPPPPPDLAGTVSAVTGTCPSIVITVGSRTATTSATTVFLGKTCADVKAGAKVGIYGAIAAGATTLTATKVVIR